MTWKHAVTYEIFLNIVIYIGIKSCKAEFQYDEIQKDGAVSGFEACRGMAPADIVDIYEMAKKYKVEAVNNDSGSYYWFREFEYQIAWVLSCISHAFEYSFIPKPIEKAAELVDAILYKGQVEAAEIVIQPVGIHYPGMKASPTRWDVIGIDMYGKRHFLTYFHHKDVAHMFAIHIHKELNSNENLDFQRIAEASPFLRKLSFE